MKSNLLDLKKGDIFKVIDFSKECKNFKHRIESIGLFKGQLGQVINKSFFGPIEIDIDGRKIAIGRGMAKKIVVQKFF
jgi:ferrous iron transport protein A